MIELVLAAWALWVLADCIVKAHEAWCSFLATARVEAMAKRCKPLTYSEAHKPVLPLLMGMADELGVTCIEVERKGNRYSIGLEFAWWAKFVPGRRKRIVERARVLMDEGGIKCACEACQRRQAA
jgi:hypothetical protein